MELAPPQLEWKNGAPVSTAYGDPYFMVEDGLNEARYVFLQSNGLPQRLSGVESFTIGETGFGSGLNFLALWQMWLHLPEPRPRLHYITTELHPMQAVDMQRTHAHWPELAEFSRELLQVSPPAIAGAHRRWLAGGEIIVDFLFGDAAQMLLNYQPAEAALPQVDAWFLDGFAPSCNPQMWQPELFAAMARLSGQGTTLASFTAAGDVRRGLQDAGFAVQKQRGFGRKREMIVGQFQFPPHPDPGSLRDASPQGERGKIGRANTALVIGAGIAGISSAWRLAQRGVQVTLLETAGDICTAASGNPAAAFTPFYTAQWNARSRFLASGFAAMQQVIAMLQAKGHRIHGGQMGTLMLALEGKRAARLHKWQESLHLPPEIRRDVTAQEASDIAGVALESGGWFYPQGGWWHMRDIAQALLDDAGERITLHLHCRVERIEHRQGQWQVSTQSGENFSAPQLVLATAHQAAKLLPELMLEPVKGQSISFAAPPLLAGLKTVIHAGHTLIPLPDGRLNWGSTFHHIGENTAITEEDSRALQQDLITAFPALAGQLPMAKISAWAGLRCTHPSHLPLIGPAPGQPEGLFLNLAHGARGLSGAMACFAPRSED